MTFEVTSTGVNPNCGEKGEKRIVTDDFVLLALRRGWIEKTISYKGKIKKVNGELICAEKISFPVKRVHIYEQLKKQKKIYKRIKDDFSFLIKQNKKIEELLENSNK